MEDSEQLAKALDVICSDKIDTIGYTNFLSRHLTILFKSMSIDMPKLSYDIRMIGDTQSITVEYDGVEWTVLNQANEILYYVQENVYTLTPSAVSAAIFRDILMMMNYLPPYSFETQEI